MYALNVDKETDRIMSATSEQFAVEGMPIVEKLPQGDISEYLYQNGDYVYSPKPKPDPGPEQPTQLDRVQAQADYTAMMTNTLLEV